ncbi:hypothetical protein MMC29_003813 [Sticta canariensis]|nr:hypothetical protein [Sticta canariensis]
MPRYMPSGAQLPAVWNKEMDRFICQCEALGDVDSRTMVRGLKKKFPQLEGIVISPDSIERRILMLEQMDNDYFVLGMQTAVARAEAAGFPLPPMDFEKYARKRGEEVAATKPATLAGEARSTSKANTGGYEDALAEGEGSAQGPSDNVLGSGKTNEKKSVEAPAAGCSGHKSGFKGGLKAALGLGKENDPGSASGRHNAQELQYRNTPSIRPNGG